MRRDGIARSWVGVAALAALAAGTAACGGAGENARPSSAPPAPSSTAPAPAGKPGLARSQGDPQVTTIAQGLEVPWEIAFLPDGRALITERPGRVRLMGRDRRLAPQPVAEVDVSDEGEGGLLGLAVDPQFRRNRFVYLYRTNGGRNEVLRYRLDGVRLRRQAVVVDDIPAGFVHDGGRLHFSPGARLYIATGEAGSRNLAQTRASLAGKFLTLGPSQYRGSRPVRPAVHSIGHRNSQGFDWQPGTGRLIASEHGPSGGDGPRGFDEVNVVERGRNYGWPLVFGDRTRAGLVAPVVVWEEAIAPSGATFVSLPRSAWTGDFLVATLTGEQMRRVSFDGDRVTGNEALFDGEYGRLRTVVEGPDGALYALTSNRDGRGSPEDGDDRVLRIVPPAG